MSSSMSHIPNEESWEVVKPAVEGGNGLVASQHRQASAVGAEVLRQGGNAVDAAVATGLAIGCVEPWMSGIGGGGFMMVHVAKERKTYAVEFGMVAPQGLDPETYPLREDQAGDLFGWPGVVEDRNIHGPHSIAVPGHVAGMALALERFGTRSWQDSIAPAIDLAEQGLLADWYATVMIGGGADIIRNYDETARTYLPGGLPAAADWQGNPRRVMLGRLKETLMRLSEVGPRDFYEGELARAIVADAQKAGSTLSLDDLQRYRASVHEADAMTYRDVTVHSAPGLTAGPTLRHTLNLLAESLSPGGEPDAASYGAYADALLEAYAQRLETMGDNDEDRGQSCTTHLSVVDKDGNLVALTQTLLSLFGSRVMLPSTGILMNNGIMWFDPRPGRPNSIRAGRKPLSNMCPVIVEQPSAPGGQGAFRYALGASGGRRIMPAVMQIISSLADFGGDVRRDFARPRIDVSGSDLVSMDARLPADVQNALAARHKTRTVQHGVYPPLFACPNLAGCWDEPGRGIGAAYIMSPWAKVVAA